MFVCGRHTCLVCRERIHPSETTTTMTTATTFSSQSAMTMAVIQCYRCPRAVHLTCQQSSSHQVQSDFVPLVGSFGHCRSHAPTQHQLVLPPSLKANMAIGDIVLVLEFGNSVLPRTQSVGIHTTIVNQVRLRVGQKYLEYLMMVWWQWGNVVDVEHVESGSQLLKVELFSSGEIITLMNRHALLVMPVKYEAKVYQTCHDSADRRVVWRFLRVVLKKMYIVRYKMHTMIHFVVHGPKHFFNYSSTSLIYIYIYRRCCFPLGVAVLPRSAHVMQHDIS